jgi:hypothetical protein
LSTVIDNKIVHNTQKETKTKKYRGEKLTRERNKKEKNNDGDCSQKNLKQLI